MFLFVYILIGVFLGPSFLKVSAPEWLFSVCSFVFLFIAGFELDLQSLKKDFTVSVKMAGGAFLLPFIAGLGFSYLALQKSDFRGLIVVALALAISALPVVVQILRDLKVYGTRQGHVIIAAATICDLLAWLFFMTIIPSESRDTWILSHLPVFFFFLGVGLSGFSSKLPLVTKISKNASKYFFGPIFFIGVGMKVHIFENLDLSQSLWIFLIASFSKMIGVFATARRIGFSKDESSLMAFVLNARGAIEILFCSIALKTGLINATLFTSLVIMAVLSSVIPGPMVRLFVLPRN